MEIIRDHYDSISAFKDALVRPLSPIFQAKNYLASTKPNYDGWSGTDTYEQALDLLEHGDKVLAEKIEKRLAVAMKTIEVSTKRIPGYSVVGYQASVPRYLQGIPTNMITSKNINAKKKVITVSKSIGYAAIISGEKIIDESVKALMVVATLEAQGFRCNLDLLEIAAGNGQTLVTTIRIKHASERMNLSKMAFCLANPAMSRRLMFRHTESHPMVSDSILTGGSYGNMKSTAEAIAPYFKEKVHLIPGFITDINALVEAFKK